MDSFACNLAELQKLHAENPAGFEDLSYHGRYIQDAVIEGDAQSLKWLLDVGAGWTDSAGGDDDLVGMAVDDGHIAVLECLFQSDYPWRSKLGDLAERAVFSGETETLDWLVGNGFVRLEDDDHELVCCAIRESHLETLEWLHTHGATLNSVASACAVKFNKLEAFHFLLDRGVPWVNDGSERGEAWYNAYMSDEV
jgi:hypothetical protein